MAGTYTFTPSDSDLWDLEHERYYTWGIELDLPAGETVVAASLFLDDIRNWRTETNDLWVHLLDLDTTGCHAIL